MSEQGSRNPLDFNDCAVSAKPDRSAGRDEIRAALLAKLESVLFTLFPAGKVRRGKFYIGDILGSPGDSLEIILTGAKAGLWTDRESGDGGDVFTVIALNQGIDAKAEFPRLLAFCADLVGRTEVKPLSARKGKPEVAVDDLGPATAKWDYVDAGGQLIAVVYRYDPPGRKKEFRPWDAKRRKMAPPDPRPLYNQPGMARAEEVVLVEGEKCAQTLIDLGICATTAMHGANAPVDKTDWSPLSGKAVLIWPDCDKPGWEYAMAVAQAALAAGAVDCHVLLPADDRPEGWDAADAMAEGFDVAAFIENGPRMSIKPNQGIAAQESSVWATEDALALEFTSRYGEDWRYCALWSRWLMWTGKHWKNDDTLLVSHLIRSIGREVALKADSHRTASKLASAGTVTSVERLARMDRRHAATTDIWDADLWLINTPKGVVDLRTGTIRLHRREDFMIKMTHGTLTPGSRCEVWLRFVNEIAGHDPALVAYLQRVFGYCLTGATLEHALFFLYGTGANGKSVFVNSLLGVLGDYGMNAPMETFMSSRNDRHPAELAMLRGARLVVAAETEQGRSWNESRVKELTGGDLITARDLYQSFFTYPPQFKPILTGNHKPALRNIDEAIRRRFHLIPFIITIPPEKRDKSLQRKLLRERDGIFEWALEGCIQWQRDGLRPPEIVRQATDEYFEAEDSLGRWMEERCVLTPSARSLTNELFADWKQWAEMAGEYVGTQKRLSELLQSRGIEKWRNSGGLRGLQGIGLRVPAEPRNYPYMDNN
jgi:phage/plasmid primase, P4 family, C-terminal domain